ncbi:hypothetical protein RND71_042243 [Anisodus tanguticus]|uniref:Uncharacterized protein n=1 Tax=Anisodus tanguticus TaxID=243964 RepID=A0AAE1QR26_9SOLA|nr:hypothetical protein RND71_042243 [Anisodus tanguticus]
MKKLQKLDCLEGTTASACCLAETLTLVDMLQEENESLLEKLRLAEERCEEAEARARQLEQQAALKVAAQTYGGKGDELAALRTEAELLCCLFCLVPENYDPKNDIESRGDGIHADIAGAKQEYWSSLAPLSLEVVLEAGQKAKDETSLLYNDPEERETVPPDLNELLGDGNVESMLLVDKGLRELTSLKVDGAVALTMAQQRRPTALRATDLDYRYNVMAADDMRPLPIEGQSFSEAYG